MDITVVGAGGVGGYFGGVLAKAGHNVTFMARGEHLKAIKENGLMVVHQGGEFTVKVRAMERPEGDKPPHLVIFAVKNYDTNTALPFVSELLGPDTCVLTLQNGVESYSILERKLGQGRVLPGAAYIESRIDAPGVIRQTGNVVRIVMGEADGSLTPRAKGIHEALVGAGINTELSPNVVKTLWTKFIFIAAVAGISSACRTRIGELMENEGYKNLLLQAMKEIEAVGRAGGVALDEDVVDKTMEYISRSVKDITASMHIDLDRGRRLELEAFNGTVARLGSQMAVPVPVNNTLYLVLKPFINGK